MSDFSKVTIVELAAIVANHLQQHDISVVLVGGLAVEIYSKNIYLTNDIDMIDISYQKPAKLHKAMAEIGFAKQGRIFVNPSTEITVEFPSGPVTVGDELVSETTVVTTAAGDLPVLQAGDVIKDRLSAYLHWNDKQSLVQAVTVLAGFPAELNAACRFCRNEGSPEASKLIKQLLAKAADRKIGTMDEFDRLVVETMLEQL